MLLNILSSHVEFLDFLFHVMFVLLAQRDDKVLEDRDHILRFPASHITPKIGSQKA